uniref:tRNA (adenine(58)-N(1))-methyltransferase non-catalytic subunit TRM6 n=1 Tax=Graphocephala atropunctata TaxID=36148 RepID=A0A1B6KPM0_9HEMI
MCDFSSNCIVNGQYVIFRRKEYKKLHLLSEKNTHIFIGKDKVEVSAVLGEKIGSVFKLLPKRGLNRHFTLKLCNSEDLSCISESYKDLNCGLDNRNICDDGSSQLLTSDSIEELRDNGTAPKAIIEQLIENSKTFQIKTEYSQEKYIKKKEKKYFEFISVIRPTIRLLADIFYSRELPKSIGIRLDTLSQLSTALNFQPDGCYLLVENGFNGIVAATLLDALSNEGRLIHITPGNQNQKQAVLAMNFLKVRMSQLTTVRLSTLTELMEKNASTYQISGSSQGYNVDYGGSAKTEQYNESDKISSTSDMVNSSTGTSDDILEEDGTISACAEFRKRKHSNLDSKSPELELKKPRWAVEAEDAIEVLKKKVDGLIVACKEFPVNIVNKLFKYMLPSRPFVIYSLYQEPLLVLYLQLKQRTDVVNLKITETWFRPYQILPERSHPAVNVSSSSGYLLSGIKVLCK